jgi:hypothetical protein
MPRTLEVVRSEGLEALNERLGRADTIRFRRQFETGSGDYPKDRRDWMEGIDLAAIEQAADVECAHDCLPDAP